MRDEIPSNWLERWNIRQSGMAIERAMANETDRTRASLLYSIERREVADDTMPLDQIAPIYLTLAINLRDGERRNALIRALGGEPA